MKRDKNLRNLSSDHHNALALVRKIHRAVSENNDVSVLVDHLKTVFANELSPHFDIEERAILPELTRTGEHSLVRKTLDDHASLRRLIKQLDKPGNLIVFADTLKAHVRFEEQELFEVCQKVLDTTAMAAIGRACKH